MSSKLDLKNANPQNGLSIDIRYCHDYFEGLFKTNFFKCLNDETRQKIILCTGLAGQEGMRVADIAAQFELDRTTISHHLGMLRDSNLLKLTKRGKERYYSVNTEYVTGVLEEVVNILKACCEWDMNQPAAGLEEA